MRQNAQKNPWKFHVSLCHSLSNHTCFMSKKNKRKNGSRSCIFASKYSPSANCELKRPTSDIRVPIFWKIEISCAAAQQAYTPEWTMMGRWFVPWKITASVKARTLYVRLFNMLSVDKMASWARQVAWLQPQMPEVTDKDVRPVFFLVVKSEYHCLAELSSPSWRKNPSTWNGCYLVGLSVSLPWLHSGREYHLLLLRLLVLSH